MSSSAGILPLYRLVSPTTTVTLAAATSSANKTFSTNLPIGSYMNIRRAKVIGVRKVTPADATFTDQYLYELTEDTNKTVVAQQDPFALLDGGFEELNSKDTGAGFVLSTRNVVVDSFVFDDPHPGVPTVAQQLNLVATSIRVVDTSVQSIDWFVQLYFEIKTVTEDIRSFLTNRIVLQRTT